ncbi:PDGLE domain-containing protein [Pseudonocardia humida]|uniref:PDGLE domain-containing protein n=1 Tax=Pseudonocardia humida TaxID=2800819 RepID=A0ABT1A757_9PSEU|nr:PDGLE domain-containing protein [Pseudonocardia humida]MCO1658852.1 PDGLE domain-containing protein [Pseudonocardia humida]
MTRPARPTRDRRATGFFVGFLVVALLIAGGLSYFASSDPDGLDSVTLEGCSVVETDAGEQLEGTCIARNAEDHALGSGPLADYAVDGADGTVGPAGVIGVLVTALLAGGLFWLLRGRGTPPDRDGTSGS